MIDNGAEKMAHWLDKSLTTSIHGTETGRNDIPFGAFKRELLRKACY